MAHNRQRSRPPPHHPPDDHDLKHKAIAGFAQGIGRGLIVIIWEWIKAGHHL